MHSHRQGFGSRQPRIAGQTGSNQSQSVVKLVLTLVAISLLLLGGVVSIPAASSADASRNWAADNGNGTYSNPLFYEEFEDPDPIRVGDDYYLASTTMHMNPAVILMHSKDLVNWELAGYCTNKLDLGPEYRLEAVISMAGASGRPASAITTACFTFSPTSMGRA